MQYTLNIKRTSNSTNN